MEVYKDLDVPMWLLILIFLAVLLYSYGTYPLNKWQKLGVPGPRGIPFFGSAMELYDKTDKFYATVNRWQKEYGRIVGITLFRKPVLIVTDPEALRQIFLKDFNNFTDRYFVGDGQLEQDIVKKTLFFAEGKDWQRIRHIITPIFSGARMKPLIEHINRTAKQLTDNVVKTTQEGNHLEAKNIFLAYSMDVLAGITFGLKVDTLNDPSNHFIKTAKRLVGIDDFLIKIIVILACTFPVIGRIFHYFEIGLTSKSALDYFRKYVFSLIDERKKHQEASKQSDFLQSLLNVEADPSDDIAGSCKLSLSEVAAQGLIFLVAGYETMSTCLQYLTYELGRHKDEQAKIVSEISEVIGTDSAREPTYEDYQKLKYTEAAINEILRMYPPLHLQSRKTTRPTELRGFHIPANTGIFIPTFSLVRDPTFFNDPDTFDPERFFGDNKNAIDPVSFTPFGYGPRQCIGNRLSMFVVKAALVYMLRKVTIEGVTPETLDIDDYTPLLIPKTAIKLILSVKDGE